MGGITIGYLRQNKKHKFTLSVFISIFIVLLVLFPLAFAVSELVVGRITSVNENKINQTLNTEKQQLLQETKSVAGNSEIATLVGSRDIKGLNTILADKKMKFVVSGISAIDVNGMVLTQLDTPVDLLNEGSIIFFRTAFGQKIQSGGAFVSIEKGRTFPLMMMATAPIIKSDKTIGYIIIRQSFDAVYAAHIKQQSKIGNSELLLYSQNAGVLGTTFAGNEVKEQLSSYFNTSSDWVKTGKKHGNVRIDGVTYKVHNMKLTGVSGEAGGYLTFVPYAWDISILIWSFIATALFFHLCMFVHKKFSKPHPTRDFLVITVFFSIIFFFSFYEMDKLLLDIGLEKIENPVLQIYNSTLSLEPNTNTFDINSEQALAIRLASGGEAINAIDVTLDYDPTALEVTDIRMDESFCDSRFILKKEIDNTKGQVTLTCGLPSPGFSGELGTAAKLIIKPLKVGDFSVRFDDSGKVRVLANDGLGTNVLRKTTDAHLRVIDVTTLTPVTTTQPSTPIIVSPVRVLPTILPASLTHANSEKWYSSKGIDFFWLPKDMKKYRYSLDNFPSSNLVDGENTSQNSLHLDVQGGGIYYFHIAAFVDGVIGPVSNYKVMIDSEPPVGLTIEASHQTVSVGETVRFKFHSTDSLSGMQNNYYFKIDNKSSFLPVVDEPAVSFDTFGKHTVTVRAYDNAENYTDTSIDINVTGGSFFERTMAAFTDFLTRIFAFTKL